MPKLNKRQIIILAVMAVAVIYGAYDFLKPSAKKGVAPLSSGTKATSSSAPAAAGTQAASLSAAMDAAGSISRDPSARANAYIISRVATEWRGDPFYSGKIPLAELHRDSTRAGATGGTEKKADIAYTGYMQAGKKQVAVINGNDYEVGDLLPQGYILKGISPTKVILEDRRDGTVFEVLLQDFLPD